MAFSTCIKCGGRFFETKLAEPSGSNFKCIFIQCSSCGGVVGVQDFYDVGSMLEELAKKLGVGPLN